MKVYFLSFIAILFFISVQATNEAPPTVMNGYSLKDMEGFEKNWKLVTVRHRKDNGELRFTYANALAYEALKSGKIDYPKGAMFAKVAFRTEEDPLFTSSLIPARTRRYQLMVRDKEKYASTDGWTYALFDSEGKIFPEDIETQTKACVACHRIAHSRGFVFSEEMDLSPGPALNVRRVKSDASTLTFTEESVEKLPILIKKQVRSMGYKKVRSLQGEMRENIFQGTLDEIRPILSDEAIKSLKPAILMDLAAKRFSIVMPESPQTTCDVFGKKGLILKSLMSKLGKENENKVETLHFCHPQP